MKVNSYNKSNISFDGFMNSKLLKKGLQFAAENGTLFAATTTLALSTTARPLAILATPKTDKKNKQVACVKSLTSTGIGYLIALAVTNPFAKSIKKIDANPQKYLSEETILSLKDAGKSLVESKAYSMATQLFKLGLGFLIAAPKAFLTALATPLIWNKFDNTSLDKTSVISNSQITFKGREQLPKTIGKIINKKGLQNFVNNFKDTNYSMHIVAATDALATSAFVAQTAKTKKMDEKEKKPLIFNSIISTVLSIASTYLIDHLTKGSADKFVERLRKANHNDPNLAKYIEGVRIAKPILIAGCVYYIFIPIIATFLADRINFDKTKEA